MSAGAAADILLADCGNTAVKLGLGPDRVRLEPDPAAFARWLGGRAPAGLVLLPGAARTAAIVRDWWSGPTRIVGGDLPLPDLGQYAGMGLDRVVAGYTAGAGCIVIDAGTATTLTAWDRGHRCAGGLILPGAHALIRGLAASAPALPVVDPLPHDACAAQQDTRGAIAAAAGIGHPAMVAACLARLRAETGISAVIATGAGAEALAAAGVVPASAIRPWLVLEGLARLAGRP